MISVFKKFVAFKVLIPLLKYLIRYYHRRVYRIRSLIYRLTYLRISNLLFHEYEDHKQLTDFFYEDFFSLDHTTNLNLVDNQTKDFKELKDKITNDAIIEKMKALLDVTQEYISYLRESSERIFDRAKEPPPKENFPDQKKRRKIKRELKELIRIESFNFRDFRRKKFEFKIEVILSYAAVFSSAVLISSYIYTNTYFSIFNIDSSHYFQTSDYVGFSIPSLQRNIIYILIGFAIWLSEPALNILSDEFYQGPRKKNSYIFMLSAFILSGFYFTFRLVSKNVFDFSAFYTIAVVICFYFSFHISRRFFKNSSKVFILVVTSSLLLSLMTISAYEKGNNSKEGAQPIFAEINAKELILTSEEKNHIFIGKNSNYTFLYNSLLDKSIAIQNSEFKRVEFKYLKDNTGLIDWLKSLLKR